MDEFYNERFAKQVERAVLRMDDDEAEMFCRFAAYEIHKADIEANQRLIDRRVASIHKSLQHQVAKALASTVSKSGSGLPVEEIADFVDEVSKGKRADRKAEKKEFKRQFKAAWNEKEVRRDNRGRFTFEHKGVANDPYYGRHVLVPVGQERHFDLTSALSTTDSKGTTFEQAWNAPANNETAYANRRTYDRIGAGAKALQGSGNAKLEAASQLGQFAGKFGPEAEKVVGPHLRRTAYRYRGTERRPDPELMNMADQLSIHTVKRETGVERLDRNQVAQKLNEHPELRVFASKQASARYLMNKLPTKRLAALQQASGKIPPSQGVIINEDGKVVTQAVGYMDDHYLPFNLKNLKGLQGGHYVRSRSQGGLTTEDIYTGLVAGARSVTVVSRSGIFTVNFEDDFRGGRRYNDKARQMIGQYAHTLDAVQSKQVAQRKLSPDERAEIRDEIEREHAGMEGIINRADLEDMIGEREREYLTRPTLTTAELAEIDATARKDNEDDRKYRIARNEMISLAMEKKQARNYRLDGEGYAAALEALEEQFPYYIASVEHRTVHSTTADNPFTNEEDKGYVMPKYNKPAGAQAGYFAEEINGKGKVGANQTNYQNWAHNELNTKGKVAEAAAAATKEAKAAEEAGAGTAKTSGAKNPKLKEAEAIQAGLRKKEADEAIKKIAKIYSTVKDVDPEIVRAADDENFMREILASDIRKTAFMEKLRQVHRAAETAKDDERATQMFGLAELQFMAIKNAEPGGRWTGTEHAASPDAPFRFEGDAYSPAAPRVRIIGEYNVQASRARLEPARLQPGGLSDRELRDRAAAAGFIADAIADPNYERTAFMEALIYRNASPELAKQVADARDVAASRTGGKGIKNLQEFYRKESEAFHRLRTLKHNLDRQPAAEHQRATGTMGFGGSGNGGNGGPKPAPPITVKGSKGGLTLVEDEGRNAGLSDLAKAIAPRLDDNAHSPKAVEANLALVQRELGTKGLSEDASIVGSIRQLLGDKDNNPNMDNEFIADSIRDRLKDVTDEDLKTLLDRWLLSRRLDNS